MLFSVSEIQTYYRCERRWGFGSQNRWNLEPIVNAPALVVGGLVQLAVSEWTEAPAEVNIEASYVKHMTASHDRMIDRYRNQHGSKPNDAELTKVYESMDLGGQMVVNYLEYHKKPLPQGYTPVRTEQRAIVDIPNTEHWECNNCHFLHDYVDALNQTDNAFDCFNCGESGTVTWQCHQLRGTMDTFVQDVKGKFWCLERKTYDIRPTLEKLNHDFQQLCYIWIMHQLFGANLVGGVLYDGMWKRIISKRHPTLDELFFRHALTRNQAEVDELTRTLPRMVNKMAEAMQVDVASLTYNRVWQGCWDCKFERLCSTMSLGEDVDYVKQEYYNERLEPISELDEEYAETTT